ncbi:MAG: N-acetyltransferase [Candidatus Korobacteraceae bacterium]|jgi:amino-acid N-acetyltransferase
MYARKAILPDAENLRALIAAFSGDGTLLPRSLAEICENIRDFTLVVQGDELIGCGALHLYGMHLAEIRSIAVWPKYKGTGAGRVLVDALLEEAEQQHVSCVCLFTRIPEFFAHLGFAEAKREELPDKIYKDCANCPKLHECDEVAMYRGELPQFAILPRPAKLELRLRQPLVKLEK